MKKNITKILIILSLFALFAPFIAPIFAQSVNINSSLPPGTIPKSFLIIATDDASNITQTSATLHGTGGDLIPNRTLPITAYFRYTTLPISPVFCNDIYGANMISTRDIELGTVASAAFSENVTNLRPNTTYYYCAIISNSENIAYGGTGIVKQFHTNCIETTAETKSVTNIRSTSATLTGSYCSTDTVRTSFKYKKDVAGQIPPADWKKVGETNHPITTAGITYSNTYGNFSFNLTGLDPNSKYLFKAVAENGTGTDLKIFEGLPALDFTTSNTGTGTCPTNWTGTYPNCRAPVGTGTCPIGWTGTYPNCRAPTSCPTGWTGIYPNCIGPGTTGTCPTGWTGIYPNCTGPVNTGTCPTNWTGTYPNCTAPPGTGTCPTNWTGTYPNCRAPGGGGSSRTGGGGSGGGGIGGGGGGIVGGGGGIIATTPLIVGQTNTPPGDAIVRFHEGIETVFMRQIVAGQEFARLNGYREGTDLQTFAWNLADQLARKFGYVSNSGREIRVSQPDVAAYQLQLVGNQLTVYEYYYAKIVDVRSITTAFKNAAGYEYYFQKR